MAIIRGASTFSFVFDSSEVNKTVMKIENQHTTEEVLDPVCGMTISPDDAAGHTEYKGRTYYFCHPNCLAKFSADPQRYLKQELPTHSEVLAEVLDPVCGMTISPKTPQVIRSIRDKHTTSAIPIAWRNSVLIRSDTWNPNLRPSSTGSRRNG